MAPLLEYSQFSIENEDGILVCYAHRLEDCDDCQFDNSVSFALGIISSDEEERDRMLPYIEDPDEISEDTSEALNPDQVQVLWGGFARFDPSQDFQLGNSREDTALSPPLPLSSYAVVECGECKLRWLVGKDGEDAAMMHPSHHTRWLQWDGTMRSLLVQVSASCSGAETQDARAAMGIYFHEDSQHNQSVLLPDTYPQTQHFADLRVVYLTLHETFHRILHDRHQHIMIHGANNTERARRNARAMRVVIITDSSFFVEGYCQMRPKWEWDSWHCGYTTLRGETIKYSMEWKGIEDLVRLSATEGISVAFWQVPEGENWKASQLAWRPLEDSLGTMPEAT